MRLIGMLRRTAKDASRKSMADGENKPEAQTGS
jgi:hypothetical protein